MKRFSHLAYFFALLMLVLGMAGCATDTKIDVKQAGKLDEYHKVYLMQPRGDGAPISFLPYDVLDEPIPEVFRRPFDLPAYWII